MQNVRNRITKGKEAQGSGKLIFEELKTLSGTDAGITIEVERNNTADQLQLTFNYGIIEARFLNDNAAVASGKQRDISCCNPLSVTILDGKLTITIGDDSRTVDNVSAFKGSLTTQLITGGVEVYKTQ